ncbi:MAG: UDP-N-acetylglucosamine 2-epimerase [Planctomycetota bacterium]
MGDGHALPEPQPKNESRQESSRTPGGTAVIGPGWAGEPTPQRTPARPARDRRIAVVTGSRADFGLLRPVMAAIEDRPGLQLLVVAAGAHLIPPAASFRDVKAAFDVADSVPMQKPGRATRFDDAEALGAGVARFARSFRDLEPDWVVVLGDRIEAFAAASAAAVGGWALAHLHGGDRAEGVADESMRHAISKLAHLHLAATAASADRLQKMGEPTGQIHVVGSPAIDGLAAVPAMADADYDALGSPRLVVLLHPTGRSDESEEHVAATVLAAVRSAGAAFLVLAPNHDPGRGGVLRAIREAVGEPTPHVPRDRFVGLLRRVADAGGALVGNSSAGLIEAPALGLRVLDVGPRQQGRERPEGVHHAADPSAADLERAILRMLAGPPCDAAGHPYGDGHAGVRVAALLAEVDPHSRGLIRKLNTY